MKDATKERLWDRVDVIPTQRHIGVKEIEGSRSKLKRPILLSKRPYVSS